MQETIPNSVLWAPMTERQEDAKASRETAARRAGLEPCELCGRGVSKDGNGFWIEVVDGGSAIAKPGTADESDSGYMGHYLVGPECGRKVPAAYRADVGSWVR